MNVSIYLSIYLSIHPSIYIYCEAFGVTVNGSLSKLSKLSKARELPSSVCICTCMHIHIYMYL